jgi:hypothetical protein
MKVVGHAHAAALDTLIVNVREPGFLRHRSRGE